MITFLMTDNKLSNSVGNFEGYIKVWYEKLLDYSGKQQMNKSKTCKILPTGKSNRL